MVKEPVSNALSAEWIVIEKKYYYNTTYNTLTILLHFFCLIIKCGHIVSDER